MAKVKTAGGKVILKDGKVSCECCEGETCCMYPASGLAADPGYTAADLPETLWVKAGGTIDEEFTKDGSRYKNTDNTLEIINTEDNWRLQVVATEEDIDVGFEGCLITGDGNLEPGNDAVEDQFAADYTVEITGDSYPVRRESLCVWRGVDSFGQDNVLVYTAQGGSLWRWWGFDRAEEVPDGALKDPEEDQSSPEGTYYGYNADDEEVVVTVSP